MSVLRGIVYGVLCSNANVDVDNLDDEVKIHVFIDSMRTNLWPDTVCWTSICFDLEAALDTTFNQTQWDLLGGFSSDSNTVSPIPTIGDILDFLDGYSCVTAESMARSALAEAEILTRQNAAEAYANRDIHLTPRLWSKLRRTLSAELCKRNDEWKLRTNEWQSLGTGSDPRVVTISQIATLITKIAERSVPAACERQS